MKPLLRKLSEISPPALDWLGVSYGLTRELYTFWKKNEFEAVYIRQTKNNLTGEHTVIMLKSLLQNSNEVNNDWLPLFINDF